MENMMNNDKKKIEMNNNNSNVLIAKDCNIILKPLQTKINNNNNNDDNNSNNNKFLKPIGRRLEVADVSPAKQNAYNLKFKIKIKRMNTGIVYDERMLDHLLPKDNNLLSEECPDRIIAIWNELKQNNLVDNCNLVNASPISVENVLLVHSIPFVQLLKNTHLNVKKSKSYEFIDQYNDTYMSQGSLLAARVAAGGLLKLSYMILKNQQKNGFAIIRPPGHHACSDRVSGFCLMNNVAIVAKSLIHHKKARKIAIVDFDVHHGDGTQKIFYNDPNVLFISIHRYDGKFFPKTGSRKEIGGDNALGKTINIPLRKGSGNYEYCEAFKQMILPILNEFNADLIMCSAGFDAVEGDPLGGMKLSPLMYGHITKSLMKINNGKVVLALEGGYEKDIVAKCVKYCVKALSGQNLDKLDHMKSNQRNFLKYLKQIKAIQKPYWKCLNNSNPRNHVSEEEISHLFKRLVV